MLKAFKYRIYPNGSQKELIAKHIGCARLVYNLALETKQMAWAGSRVNLTCFDLNKQLPDLKKEFEWLKEVNSQSLQQAIVNLDTAYMAFFKGQNDYPKFKKKLGRGSFNIPQNVRVADKLFLPKFKEGIKIILHRPIKGIIKQATISRTPTGKYFVSILCETGEACKPKTKITEDRTVGVDLGLKYFAVTSEGVTYANPRRLRLAQARLKYIQRKYSKYKGKRTKHKLAMLHEKVANQRKDFLHKVSSELIKNHDSIALETLNVSGMLKNHSLAQAISDVGWYTLVSMMEYKAEWYGNNILRIGRFEPSSHMDHKTGVLHNLTLNDRVIYHADGTSTDRDLNAAINIKNFALKNILSGTDRKNHGELPTLVGVMTHEA